MNDLNEALREIGGDQRRAIFRYSAWRWARYLVAPVPVVITFVALRDGSASPWSQAPFLLVFGLVVASVLCSAIAELSNPRAFTVRGRTLTIEWANSQTSYDISEVDLAKRPSPFFLGARTLVVRGKRVMVFRELKGFDEFVRLLQELSL